MRAVIRPSRTAPAPSHPVSGSAGAGVREFSKPYQERRRQPRLAYTCGCIFLQHAASAFSATLVQFPQAAEALPLPADELPRRTSPERSRSGPHDQRSTVGMKHGRRQYLECREGQCRWPLNDVTPISDFQFCGAPAKQGCSWCERHRQIGQYRSPSAPSWQRARRLGT
jgi:GcrA cell cycle regulator